MLVTVSAPLRFAQDRRPPDALRPPKPLRLSPAAMAVRSINAEKIKNNITNMKKLYAKDFLNRIEFFIFLLSGTTHIFCFHAARTLPASLLQAST